MSQCKMDNYVYKDCATNRTDRVKLSFKQINFGLASLAFALTSLPAITAQAAGPARDATGPRLIEAPRQPETQVIRLHPGQLPDVNLTGDIFYRVIASEIAAQRGLYGPAATTLINLARDTSDPRLARRALEFQLAGGNLPGALEAARLWARLSPGDIEASSTELALSAANGQTKGLAQALRERIEATPDKTGGITQAMSVLSRLNDRRLALRILDEALSDKVRKLPVAHLALADAAQAAGDFTRADSEARAALLADPRSEAAAQRVLEYGAKVDPARAEEAARAFIARNPNARKLRLMLAAQMAERGDYDSAQAELAAMSRSAPEDFDLLFMQAQLAYKAGHLNQARSLLLQYLDVQDQRKQATVAGASDAGAAAADAHVLLARIAEDQGRYDEAIAELERVDDPSMRYAAHMRQAALRARQGRIEDALALVDAAGALDDEEQTLGVLTKAQILRDAGQVDKAAALLAKADKDLPDTVEIKYELAMLSERQGKVAQLEKLLRQVIALDPEHAHAYNALGYTLADRNQRLPEALDLITQALELSPNDPFILDSMGWVKFRMGDLPAAAEYLQRAYALRPEPDIAAHLAEVLYAQGKRSQAEDMLRELHKRDPKNGTVLDTMKRLGVQP
ncbi:tetratricopeptide repeat protein [Bordetella avium]|nr:tetratricopeptide repeat protein [Bordetella avium]RIQ16776.1 tetratricopeptide repeat protein [Bordetella avium]RIQ35110.1 tetratricopeptide repeat protein [Bordetella avium]RIQ49457.1 tetratricopeptide repeat protein [Bordetella avium]RIQ74670.1 tetratricopeptide repeat protein [Bordetella avium]